MSTSEPDLGEEPRATQAIEGAPEAAPVSSSERIAGFDVARAIAFVGMVAVNYRVVLDPLFSQRDPAWLNDAFSEVTGRAAALFVILAGVGTTLMGKATRARRDSRGPKAFREGWGRTLARTLAWTGALGLALYIIGFHAWSDAEVARDFVDLGVGARIEHYEGWLGGAGRTIAIVALSLLGVLALARLVAERLVPGVRLRLFSRAALLLGLGYGWYPIWNGDILHYYGVFLVVGALALGWRSRWIAVVAALVPIGAVVWQLREDYTADWSMLVLEYEHFWEPRALFRNLVFNGWHPILPWLTFFLVGLLVGRGPAASRRFAGLLIVSGLLCAAIGRFGAEAGRELLIDREETLRAEAFPLAPIELGAGARVVAGPVLDVEGNPPRTSRRISLDIRPEIDRDAAQREMVDARRLRRYLRTTQDRHAFRGLSLTLRPRPGGAEGEVEMVLRFGEDPAVALADGADERFRSTARAFAAWMGERAGPPFGQAADASFFGAGATWPGTLEHLRIERLAPLRDAAGALTFAPVESMTASRTKALALDREELKLRRLTHGKSWPNPSPFFLLGAGGSALALIGLCLLVTRSRLGRRLTWPLATAGRMALTLYVAHIVLGLGALDLIGKASGEDLPFIAFAVLVCGWVGISAACAWRGLFRLGPLEQILRWLAR